MNGSARLAERPINSPAEAKPTLRAARIMLACVIVILGWPRQDLSVINWILIWFFSIDFKAVIWVG